MSSCEADLALSKCITPRINNLKRKARRQTVPLAPGVVVVGDAVVNKLRPKTPDGHLQRSADERKHKDTTPHESKKEPSQLHEARKSKREDKETERQEDRETAK